MNHSQIAKESKKWVEEEIITDSQRHQLLERYPKRGQKPLLLTFAAIFIGLGFLTFIASNWSRMDDLVRMGIIIGFLIAFYVAGERIYTKYSNTLGVSFILIALLIFGSGIFLIGQMYHYTSYSAFPFFIWAIAACGLYVLWKEWTFFISAIGIITVGQIYSGFVYQQLHFLMALLFLVVLGVVVYRSKEASLTLMFGISYLIQSLILVLSEDLNYYWLMVFFLTLYLADDLVVKKGEVRVFKTLSVIAVFTLHVFGVFLLGQEWITNASESSFLFFLLWAVLFVGAVIRAALSSTNYYWADLILFVPVFKFPIGDAISLGVLFLYSLIWLIFGYRTEVSRWVNKGTATFLFTTFLAYFQLAWDFMNRSVFFFTGGILLFLLSFFLERKRRQVHKGGRAE
ncbi:DUF2157 domain-containing protein [Halobacillus salinus]|uniref:DUF2157 domain-containing protein n=1 Tax=Halobacillus salinus TaxID=192814 RepID=A0A4Z0H5Y2_9BACI|nr:DUF2157 domain-containing protein [Halobacillus salinus]TGB05254.1 DUF2157 domain-containing protein [Halobacillus salinus]